VEAGNDFLQFEHVGRACTNSPAQPTSAEPREQASGVVACGNVHVYTRLVRPALNPTAAFPAMRAIQGRAVSRPTRLSEAQSNASGFIQANRRSVVCSLAVLVLAALCFMLVAITLVTFSSPGPVISQSSAGFGRSTESSAASKFQTTIASPDDRCHSCTRYLEQSPRTFRRVQERLQTQADPAFTPIGRFLRRSSLDGTFPKFLNVSGEQMSVVGLGRSSEPSSERLGDQMDTVLRSRAWPQRPLAGVHGSQQPFPT